MIYNCPNLVAGVKTVALGNGAGAGAGYGAGCGVGGGMGMHAIAGCCKAACAPLLGVGFIPLVLTAAVGYLGYKVYTISQKEENN